MSDRVNPRGLSFIRSCAVASVYATHMHNVPFNLSTQAMSGISHFFLFSGLLSYLSLLSQLSKTSLGDKSANGSMLMLKNVTRFVTYELWITWVVFLLKRMAAIAIYCYLFHWLIAIHSASNFHPPNPERRMFINLWNHWWNSPNGQRNAVTPQMWFLSCLSLYWVLTTPIASLLYALPDLIALIICSAYTIFSIFAIEMMPHTTAWYTYYFSPQTHWVPYLLGVCVWRARVCPMTNNFFKLPIFTEKSSILNKYIFPLFTEIFSYTFIWWQRHIISHKIRPENDFVDVLYRTTTYMGLILFLWSTPLADRSLVVKYAAADYWNRVAPGGVNLGIYITQWSIGYTIYPHMKDRAGRILCLIITYYASLWSETFVLKPLRDLLTPYFNKLQAYASRPPAETVKDTSIAMFSFKAVNDP